MTGIEEEMKLLEQGQLFLFLTDYKEAEDLYRDAFKRSHPKQADYNDLRPLYGLLFGLTSIIKSISCLGRSHIKESLKRFQAAEKILHHQKDWTGRKILKGILLASIGGIEVSQKNIVKGIVTLSKSTKYLKVIQKSGIHYDGIESNIIRSLSLLMLGLLQVTYSFLSDTKGKVAKWLSGFSGNKSLGIENLKRCFNEDGLFSTWAGLAYIFIHTDTNNILGCRDDNQESLTFCKQVITRCKEKYEQFGILAVAEVNVNFLERNIMDAEKVLSHNRPLFQLPGGKLTFFTKCGIVHLCNMKFLEAGSSFKHGMDELMKVGQRGMVPSNSFFAFLCLLQVLKEIKEEEDKTNEAYLTLQVNTERSVSRLLRVFDWCMKKKSYTWGPGDKEFYIWVEDYVDFDPFYQQKDTRLSIRTIMKRIKSDNWILLDILEKVIIELYATSFMSDELLSEYLERIEEEEEQRRSKITKIQQMKLLCFKAEILSQMREYKGALTELNKLDFKKKKQKTSSLENYLFLFSEFIKARIEFDNNRLEAARTIIKKIKKISSDSHRYKQYLSSRKALLLERIDSEYCKTHKKIQVSKRGRVTFSYDLSDDNNINKLIENEHILQWNLVGGCNSCKVEIYHKQQKRKAKKKVLGTMSKDTDLRESVDGTLKNIPKNGTLFFKFDNHKNMLHGKTFYFRIQPELNLSHVQQEKQEEDVQVSNNQEQ